MNDLLAHVEASIGSRKLLSRGQRVLVAVSGGLDSMVLLHLLRSLAAKHRWKLIVAHFNHQLRRRSSDADESLVRKTADASDFKCIAGRGAVKVLAKERGQSIEMAARELRHAFLARTARKLNCRVVAVAHHADDQVELFFLRLLRGAGSEGLAGMKWLSPSPVEPQILLVRPLLDVSRAELKQFARENKIRFREDASNASLDFQRNQVRHELLPLLRRRYQPALDRAVLRLMDIVRAESEVVTGAAQTWLKRMRGSFSALPVGLQRRVLQIQLRQHNIPADYERVESLRTAANKPLTVSRGVTAVRDAAGRLTVYTVSTPSFNEQEVEVGLEGRAGEVVFGEVGIRWHITRQCGARLPSRAAGREVFDADKIGPRIVLRHWRAGDRFQPIGLPASVKLQDLFTNRKIPQSKRRDAVVATMASGDIFWVEGLRIGERFKLNDHTRRRLKWRWRRL